MELDFNSAGATSAGSASPSLVRSPIHNNEAAIKQQIREKAVSELKALNEQRAKSIASNREANRARKSPSNHDASGPNSIWAGALRIIDSIVTLPGASDGHLQRFRQVLQSAAISGPAKAPQDSLL